jgi:hypothetical protein
VTAELDSPNGEVYAAIDPVTSPTDADLAGGSPQLYRNTAIIRALKSHRPVLFASLGNGRAPT